MAPEFMAGLQWLNTSHPLTMKELRGKIVMLDFWTYCCINCMHIIPDLKKLEAKYPNELVVIGVHSGKFLNEKDSSNIRAAIKRYEIEHAVINDKDMQVWTTYGANSWPTVFLIDPDGRVRGYMSGEGIFDPVDKTVAALIKEFDAKGTLNRKPLKLDLEKDKDPKTVLSYPGKITADPKGGRLFLTDSNHNRIVVLSLTGTIQQIIGEGSIGLKDGDFSTAKFFRPQGLCYDAAANCLYVADTENHAVRKVDLTGKKVTTLAGDGRQTKRYPPVGGIGPSMSLSSPWDVLQQGDLLYIAMAGTHQLWKLNLKTLAADPYAGTAGENIVDGPLKESFLAQPSGLTTDGKKLFFADSEVSAVRSADFGGVGRVKTLIGKGLFEFGDIDGKYPAARLQHPLGLAYHDGYLYVADTYNHKIRKLNPNTQELSTFIGTGKRGAEDGDSKTASLNEPAGLVFVNGILYITDTNNHLIRTYDPATCKLATLHVKLAEKAAQQ